MATDLFVSPDDLEAAGEFVVAALTPGIAADWDATFGGSLTWTIRQTVVHMASTCAFYAVHLAAGATAELPITLASVDGPGNAALLATVAATPRTLAAVARSVPPQSRAYHWAGTADVSGFLAMGCDEILIHAGDVATGLGLDWELPDGLAERVLRRLYPWAPRDVSPSDALLWVNGRRKLPGQERDDCQRWHCAPIDEWDGSIPPVFQLQS